MIYVFDSSTFSDLFKSYYRERFPSLWKLYDTIVDDGRLISTREVLREIQDRANQPLLDWAAENKGIFTMPTAEEGAFVTRIFAVQHFQQNIELKKILKGGKNADPFLVAKTAVIGGTVVTMESEPRNGVRIPNICRHFEVPCLHLEQFMEAEEWAF